LSSLDSPPVFGFLKGAAMRSAFLGLIASLALSFAALAETGTPYPPGTKVEVGTPAGTVSGTLKDRIKDGWISVLEPGRKLATAIPERSIGFVRPEALALPPPKALGDAPSTAESLLDHVVFGLPRVADRKRFVFKPFQDSDEEVDGHTVLKRFAFTLGHYNKYKVPAWVAMRWTKENFDVAAGEPTHPRNFIEDLELPPYARTGKDFQHAKFGYERGHMARHEDLSGCGALGDPRRATREGCFMSNIVPQQRKGHVVWGRLEKEHHEIVAQPEMAITSIWLIAGPVFKDGMPREIIGPAKVGAPDGVYKIIAWRTVGASFTARAYIIQQEDTGTDLSKYLTTIDAIEEATGLDFFAEMDDEEEEALESRKFTARWQEN
jgi:endonuclease G